jgi:hypothetical protein
MNRKAVEALPLRYIIMVIIAALVIAIILEFVGVLRTGILSGVLRLNQTLREALNQTP